MGSDSRVNKPSKQLLTLRDLLVYGIILIQPIAPVGIYGLTSVISKGQVVTPILFAMVAMVCTAVSYGRLAALYPSAGSAYTYVGANFSAEAGFFVGWAMTLTYIVLPIINGVYTALTLQRLIPSVPFTVWATLFAVAITVLNLCGIASISRISTVLMLGMSIVIVVFMVLGCRYIASTGEGISSLVSLSPIYNSSVFNIRAILSATSLATLTFVGFDGVTTLAEETAEPRRTVPKATVWLCVITGLFSAAEVYVAALAWPDYTRFRDQETAFMDVTQRVVSIPVEKWAILPVEKWATLRR